MTAVIAHTTCPNGHTDTVEAINPVVVDGEFAGGYWPSAFDFCMECDEATTTRNVEVLR